MKRVKLTVTVAVPDGWVVWDDPEEVNDFLHQALSVEELVLHTNLWGDSVGQVVNVENVEIDYD